MTMTPRLSFSLRTAALHLLASGLVALLIYTGIFSVWLPEPFAELSDGKRLFVLILLIDMICGPLLTLIVSNPAKPRREWLTDLSLVALIQLAALGYGIHTVMQIRPIWLGFERDQFRVVALADIRPQGLDDAPQGLQTRNWLGPRPVGVRVVSSDDPSYLESLQLSLNGYHSAFRPSHWVPYSDQRDQVLQAGQPVEALIARQLAQSGLDIRPHIQALGVDSATLLYLPLSTDMPTEWSVLVDRDTASIVGFIPVSGWSD